MIVLSLQLKNEEENIPVLNMDRSTIDQWYTEAKEQGIEFFQYI